MSVLLLLLLGAPPQYKSVRIEGVPHVKQKPDFCGEACIEMYLKKLGHPGDQDWVFDQSGLSRSENRGVWTRELKTALLNIGFLPGAIWYRVQAKSAKTELEAQWAALHKDLQSGVPSIVCMHYDDQPKTTEHFRLVLGYDAKTDEVIYHEPAVKDGSYQRMKRQHFLKLWPLKYAAKEWTVIRAQLLFTQLRKKGSE